MRISRIARPDALYGASESAHTFDAIYESIVNPRDFCDVADVNLERAAIAVNYSHMPGFEVYGRESKNGRREANRLNLPKGRKKVGISKTHFKVRNLAYLQKAITRLIPGGEITIRLPSVEWLRNEMAIAVHCDGGDILTKGE